MKDLAQATSYSSQAVRQNIWLALVFSKFLLQGLCYRKTTHPNTQQEPLPHHPNRGSKHNVPHTGKQKGGVEGIPCHKVLMLHLPLVSLPPTLDPSGLSHASLLSTVLPNHPFL